MTSPGNGKVILAGKGHTFQDGVKSMDSTRLIDIWREARMKSVLILEASASDVAAWSNYWRTGDTGLVM